MSSEKRAFTKALLKWHKKENRRKMPWKGEKDPYRIWLSEIILQQTRVDQGRVYYEKFLEAFPTVHDLAMAPEQKVFKLWEGLGYYNRCRNLIATAKKIDGEYNGIFPGTYEEILSLKGVGPYTAAAIASFAFDLPHAVVDGNVTRVLSRYFGDFTPIDSTAGKKIFTALAAELLDEGQASLYNQAIMDFGATVCLPRNPLCAHCNQRTDCRAFEHGWINQLPVKEKSIQKKQRWFYYFVVEAPGNMTYIRRRGEKDIWEGLFEFVLLETDHAIDTQAADHFRQLFGKQSLTVKHISTVYRQELSHQTIQGQFITLSLQRPVPILKDYLLIPRRQLADYAFPKLINAWLRDPSPAQSLF
ncbi:MAG TPA: A/G-specific adenine glycosylase [Chitinophagaceae bacterium]|jgi:A/G-specific adenine glycosylase|nr:A/G-specific adenine glycosylase [Chitinophagaceae bacterium]